MRTWMIAALVLSFAGAARAQTEPTEAELEAAELAAAAQDEETPEIDPVRVACPTGAHNEDGRCADDAAPGGAAGPLSSAPKPPSAGALLAVALGAAAVLFFRDRRRFALLLLVAVACGGDAAGGWDDAIDGPAGDRAMLLVQRAESRLDAAARYRLDLQPYDVNRFTPPVNAFALARDRFPGAVPLRRSEKDGNDRLATSGDGELLGWAALEAESGTAPLFELVNADGQVAYEAEPEALDALAVEGFAQQGVVAYVFPPVQDEPEIAAEDEALASKSGPAPCRLRRPALFLFYASLGEDTLSLLRGCPGEVVIGEKHQRPHGHMRTVAAHAAGGRTAYVMSNFGREIRDMLRNEGAQKTADFVNARLAAGYDYVVIDEITADPEWADSATVSRRFREMLLKVPAKKVIAYISLDLTMRPGGDAKMHGRRLLLRALKLRAKALALEVYIHTADGVNHRAPAIFRTAATRLVAAVHGMPGIAGISRHTISVIGLSVNGPYPQYRYLDWPAKDLASIHAQVNAIRGGGRELAAEHGVGFYYSALHELQPLPGAPWTIRKLATKLNAEMRRFR